MKTRQGYEYWIEDGKFTINGYDLFNTLTALETDIDWQLLWLSGKAYKGENGWRMIKKAPKAIVKAVMARGQVIAKCSHTGKFESSFKSMEAFRREWPGAEIVKTEHHNGYTVIYC